MTLTTAIAHSAGQDAANQQMRSEGRTTWNLADYNLACKTFGELEDRREAAQPLKGRSTGRKFNMSAIKREIAKKASSKFDAEKFEAMRQKRDRKPITIKF